MYLNLETVKHEIRDLQILEIFEFEIMKFPTQKLKSSKVLPDLINEFLDQILIKLILSKLKYNQFHF